MTNPGADPVGGTRIASPIQKAVNDFHRNDDVDALPESHHHTLGTQRINASPGNHTHDGLTSIAMLSGVTFTGSRTTNAADILNQIMNSLVLIGAVNNTSA